MVETLQLTYDIKKNSHSMQFQKTVIITIQLTQAYNGPSILIAEQKINHTANVVRKCILCSPLKHRMQFKKREIS